MLLQIGLKRNMTRGIATLGSQIWTAPATATLYWDMKQMETLTNPNMKNTL